MIDKEKPLKANNQEGFSIKRGMKYIGINAKLNMPLNEFLALCVKSSMKEAMYRAGAPNIKTQDTFDRHLKFIAYHEEIIQCLKDGRISVKRKLFKKYPQS